MALKKSMANRIVNDTLKKEMARINKTVAKYPALEKQLKKGNK